MVDYMSHFSSNPIVISDGWTFWGIPRSLGSKSTSDSYITCPLKSNTSFWNFGKMLRNGDAVRIMVLDFGQNCDFEFWPLSH